MLRIDRNIVFKPFIIILCSDGWTIHGLNYDENIYSNPKYSNRKSYGQHGVSYDIPLSSIGLHIFRHCLSFVSNKYG